jgi:hypothetical protein
MHSSILQQIWLSFMVQYFVVSDLIQFLQFSFRFHFFGLSTTEETLAEMRIWCIKIGIVLVLCCIKFGIKLNLYHD